MAKLKRGRFFAVNVAPGRHVLSYEKGVPVVVEAREGEELFVRLDWSMKVGEPAIPLLQVVSAAQAHDDMLPLAYIDTDKALSRSVAKTDPREPLPLMRRGKTYEE